MSVLDEETESSIPAGYQPIHWFDLPQPVASRLRPIIQNTGESCWLQRTRVEGLNWMVEPVPSDQILILWDGRQAKHIERSVCSAFDRGQPYLFKKFPSESKSGGSWSATIQSSRRTHEVETGEGERSRWGGGRVDGPTHFNVTVHIYDPLDQTHPTPPMLRLGERPTHPSRERYTLGEDESIFDVARRLYGLPIIGPLLNLNERHDYERLPARVARYKCPVIVCPFRDRPTPRPRA